MRCDLEKERLAAFIEGELEALENQEVMVHLESCPECRKLARSLSLSLEAFSACERHEARPSPLFAEKVAARASAAASRQWRRSRLAAAAAAVLAAGMILGVWLGPRLTGNRNDAQSVVTYQSDVIGLKIAGESFVLHSRDSSGKEGVDLKL